MVRAIRVIVIALMLALASITHAYAYDLYDDGTISSTMVGYFQDIYPKFAFNSDYLAFRSSQYEYVLLVGEIELDGQIFTSTGILKEIIITTNTNQSSGSNQNYYSYSVSDVNGLSLDVSDFLVYSNLGYYPGLDERGEIYDLSQIFVICVIGLCMLLRPAFSFVLRSRYG